ncbi:MAG: hypothetical protein AAB375_01910 [Patescibacteria group bacterium]
MRRGSCALDREPSKHGKEKEESSPEEEKGCIKEEEEVISSSTRTPKGVLVLF